MSVKNNKQKKKQKIAGNYNNIHGKADFIMTTRKCGVEKCAISLFVFFGLNEATAEG